MTRVPVNYKHFVGEEASGELKQKRIVNDYLELQTDVVAKKKSLQMIKQKREILLAEVRFLRRRHEHLKKYSEDFEDKQDLVAPNNSSSPSRKVAHNGNHGVYESSLNNRTPVTVVVALPVSGDGDRHRDQKKEVALEPSRMEKKRKNCVTEKRVGKKKISWQDQVGFKV